MRVYYGSGKRAAGLFQLCIGFAVLRSRSTMHTHKCAQKHTSTASVFVPQVVFTHGRVYIVITTCIFGVHIWIYISCNGLRKQLEYSLCDRLSPWNSRVENLRLDKVMLLSIFINNLMSNNTKSHDSHLVVFWDAQNKKIPPNPIKQLITVSFRWLQS